MRATITMMNAAWPLTVAIGLQLVACSHEVSGSAVLLNVQPSPPGFDGAFDFDLQPATNYTACVKRERFSTDGVQRWILGVAFDKMPGDPLTRTAIAAAAGHLIDLTDADTLVMTRVVTEAKGPDEVCATVFAHGVVLKKAERHTTPQTNANEPPP